MSVTVLRLSKLMSQRGLCSRREADRLIESQQVKVDGVLIQELGTKVQEDCEIEILESGQKELSNKVTFILNKPLGWVSGQPEDEHRSAVELIREHNRDPQFKGPPLKSHHLKGLAPIGRLDINSTGLLIYSQDGVLAKKIIGENSKIEKEYLVRVQGSLSQEQLQLLNHGLKIDGKALRPAKVEWINSDQLRFILQEGKKRQIRKMCDQVGLEILALKRVRVGQLRLGKLALGQWRFLGLSEKP